jgi:heme oxygenase
MQALVGKLRVARMAVAIHAGMHRPSWMLQQLEYATRGYHVAADAGRIALLGGNITREKYAEYLARTYAFEAPIEARWQQTAGLDGVIDLAARLRTGFLASDLRALGCPPDRVTPAPFVGIEQALGWMYVVERSRRMNSLLQRHVQRRIPSAIAVAGKYLASCAPIAARWERVGVALDHVARHHAAAEQIMNAALRAFRQLRATQPMAPGRQHAA